MNKNFKEFLNILNSAVEPPDDPMFKPSKIYEPRRPKWFYPSLTAACCLACVGVTLAVSLPITLNNDYNVKKINIEAKNHYGNKDFNELFSSVKSNQTICLFFGQKEDKNNVFLIASKNVNLTYFTLSYDSINYKFESGENSFDINTDKDSIELNFSIYESDKIISSTTFYLTLK